MGEDKDKIVGVVTVIKTGPKGPYAVARSKDEDFTDSVTFSLGKDVWREEINPDLGVYVVLTNLAKRHAGWRANKARLFKPSDQVKIETKKEKEKRKDEKKN